MRTVIEETERPAATGGIVYHLSHHRTVLVEEELIANTYLTGRLYQHIPKAQFLIEFPQEEDFNLGIRLLLRTIKAGRKHFRVVEDKSIPLAEIVHDITEQQRLVYILAISIFLEHINRLTLAVHHHQATLVTTIDFLYCSVFILKIFMRRLQCHLCLRQFESEL